MFNRITLVCILLVGLFGLIQAEHRIEWPVILEEIETLAINAQAELEKVDGEIGVAVRKIEEADQDTEYSKALQYLRFEYDQFKGAEVAMLRNLAGSIKDNLGKAIVDANRRGLVDEGLSSAYLMPVLVKRMIQLTYKDLRVATDENWRNLYKVIAYYLHYYSKKSDVSKEGLETFQSFADVVKEEMGKLQDEIELDTLPMVKELTESLPTTNWDHVNRLMETVVRLADNSRHSVENSEEVKQLMQQYLPGQIVQGMTNLAQTIKNSKLSLHQNYPYSQDLYDLKTNNFEDLVDIDDNESMDEN